MNHEEKKNTNYASIKRYPSHIYIRRKGNKCI